MEKKTKVTNAQLTKRIERAVLHIDRTKDTIGVFFLDKGLRLTVTEDYAIIETGYHRHVFNSFTNTGVSRPYLYTKRVIEIANENAPKTDDGYSFAKMLDVLKAKEDNSEYNICVYYEWWLMVIFDGLYSIAENEVSSWLVLFKYANTLAQNSIILDEHKEDMTRGQFVDLFVERLKDFVKVNENEDVVLLHAMSDEERMKAEIEAIQEQESEQVMEAQADDSQG